VPQGSVLGPFLFASIVDNLHPIHKNSTLIKYADDLTVLHFIRNKEDDRLEDEWLNVKQWCTASQLTPNAKKTKVLDVITNKALGTLANITDDDGAVIEKVDAVRLLGITLSSDLKWDNHVENVCARAAKRLFSLIQLRAIGVPPFSLEMYYKCVIRSLLLYASPAWCNLGNGLSDRLAKIDRRASRIIGSQGITPSLRETANNIGVKLMRQIDRQPNHPLSVTVVRQDEPTKTRRSKSICSCWAKTSRFRDSFTSFANKL
jgi:hypothetical protein